MPVSRDPGERFVRPGQHGGNITVANAPTPRYMQGSGDFEGGCPESLSRPIYGNPSLGGGPYRRVIESAATRLGVTLHSTQVRRRDEFERAFITMVRERVDAVVVAQDPLLFSARSQVVLQTARHRLPAIYGNREYVEAGGLMSYGPNIAHQWRRAATSLTDLKGAKPAILRLRRHNVRAVITGQPPRLSLFVPMLSG